ncbi:Zinc/iron permease [Pilatotrama ljubarskyi]|nr:Zinc/iron permease [Pilatotrama ljubarskyi]
MSLNVSVGEKALGRLPGGTFVLAVEDADLAARVLIMLVIFAVSLVAVSFPTITETYRSIRVPSICFFIGKHFGTGVILSTAFVHLLQDAFKALQNPEVNEIWPIEEWSGIIVLGSLLIIFLVEYTSTAVVDRLHSYPSAPSSRTDSPNASSASSMHMEYDADAPVSARPSMIAQDQQGTKPWTAGSSTIDDHPKQSTHGTIHQVSQFDESGHPSAAPLPLAPPELADESSATTERPRHDETTPLHASLATLSTAGGSYGATTRSSGRPPARPSARTLHISAPPDETFFAGGHHRHEARGSHSKHHARLSRSSWYGLPWFDVDEASPQIEPTGRGGMSRHTSRYSVVSGRRSTLKSQGAPSMGTGERSGHTHGSGHGHAHGGSGYGHSHGHGHGHLDMEQWMDGMEDRMNGAPPDGTSDEECGSDVEETEEVKIGRKRQVIGILVLQMGIMIHSLVIGLTLSITKGPEFTSLVVAIVFHQLFEGLSLGIRIAGLPSKRSEDGFKHISGRTLKPLLAIMFATTTPLGIGIGLAALGGTKSTGPRMMLVQGVMSAISAGMLIYAACVEMLAGDFVMDAHLWRSSVRRQVLALVSLFAGVIAMAAIGFLD